MNCICVFGRLLEARITVGRKEVQQQWVGVHSMAGVDNIPGMQRDSNQKHVESGGAC